MAQPLRFCLCADDYAISPGVSRGIVEALDKGALSATSVMTTSPFWPDTAPALTRFVDRADIGLHLNLTLGAPLGPMPTFAPRHVFPAVSRIIVAARRGTLPITEIETEIDRQFARFLKVFGRPPSHVDGHQHVHVVRPLRNVIFSALQRYGWDAWLRDSADQPYRIILRGASARKAAAVAFLAAGFADAARRREFMTNEGFSGFSAFDISADYAGLFGNYLKAQGRRHLVMCHPGYVDDDLRALDPVTESREQELRFLLSSAFEATLRTRNAVTVRLSAER